MDCTDIVADGELGVITQKKKKLKKSVINILLKNTSLVKLTNVYVYIKLHLILHQN